MFRQHCLLEFLFCTHEKSWQKSTISSWLCPLWCVNGDSPWEVQTRFKLTQQEAKSQALGQGSPRSKSKISQPKFRGAPIFDLGCKSSQGTGGVLQFCCARKNPKTGCFFFFCFFFPLKWSGRKYFPSWAKYCETAENWGSWERWKSLVWLNTQIWEDREGAKEAPVTQAGFIPILLILFYIIYIFSAI